MSQPDTEAAASALAEATCRIAIAMCDLMIAKRIPTKHLGNFVRAHNALVDVIDYLTLIVAAERNDDTNPPPIIEKLPVPVDYVPQ